MRAGHEDPERTRIHRIAAALMVPIPVPYVPPPKPAKTWHKLKPGDYLRCRLKWQPANFGCVHPGALLYIASLDSDGVDLARPVGPQPGPRWRWTDPDWPATFDRVPKKEAKVLLGEA